MNRREFMAGTAAAVASATAPAAVAAAGVAGPSLPAAEATGRWFAVSFDGERFNAFFADSMQEAGRLARDEEDVDYWDGSPPEPEVRAPETPSWLSGKEPSRVDWVEAGFVTSCDGCGAGWDEVGAERIVGDRVLCGSCWEEEGMPPEGGGRCPSTPDMFAAEDAA